MSASPLPNGRVQFVDQNGAPLTGGSVTFYVPGTSAPKRTWADPAMMAVNPSVITLDSIGAATVWGLGSYRQVVLDINGVVIWDELTQTLPYASAAVDALDSAVNTVLEQVGETQSASIRAISVPDNEVGFSLPSASTRAGQLVAFAPVSGFLVPASGGLINFTGTGALFDIAATAGQTSYTMTSPVPADWLLEVFRGGARLTPGEHYTINGDTVDWTASGAATAGERFWGLNSGGASGQVNDPQNVSHYSVTGNGVTPDDQAMQVAVNSLQGRCASLPDKYLFENTVTVPDRTTLSGQDASPSQPYLGQSLQSRNSLIISQSATVPGISLMRGSVLERGTLVYGGLTHEPPATEADALALIASMAGVGVSVTEADARIQSYLIVGFGTCVQVAPNNSVPGATSRFDMSSVRLDGVNGLDIANQYDICRVTDVHCWCFAIADLPGLTASDYNMAGTGFYIHDGDDDGMYTRCFSWAHLIGYHLSNVNTVNLTDCVADGGAVTSTYKPIGVLIDGDSWGNKLNNLHVETQNIAVQVNTTYVEGSAGPSEPAVSILGGRLIAGVKSIDIIVGNVSIIGTTIGGSGIGINIGPHAGNVSIVCPEFMDDLATFISIDPAYVGRCTIFLGGSLNLDSSANFSIPYALIEAGQVTIDGANLLEPYENFDNCPSTQFGVQPRNSMSTRAAPTGQRRWSDTVDALGDYRIQAMSDDGTSVLFDGLALYRNASGFAGMSTGLLPGPYANDAAAASAGINVGGWYYTGSAIAQRRS